MRSPKILDNTQINWFSEDVNRLSYQMIFEEPDFSEPETDNESAETPDIAELLAEQEQEWKAKLEETKANFYQQGFEEGFQKGLEEARAELDGRLQVLEKALEAGSQKWQEQQQKLQPGIMELVFNITESILGIPVENPKISEHIEENLGRMLQKIDDITRPVLHISEADYELVRRVIDEYAPKSHVVIITDKQCNPGEFVLETTEETLVYKFNEMLQDFRNSLNLPKWK